ncbi:gallate dioxygenase [Klebsiella oxytoca]|uniref:gallate dioxygenase n=1 Tax=Klebsiella oxytoca TaxID=571 RepID=UPI003570B3FA
MAKIIGGLAVSHTPTIGFAVDHNKQKESAWEPIFDSFAPMQAWLEEHKPDALVYVFNDHVTSFFFDHYSAFSLGIDNEYAVADEGGGPRDLPPIKGDAALARHIGSSLMSDEFDMSFFMDKPLDHGMFSPLSALMSSKGGWPVRIVPLQVGVLQFPIPTAKRCFKLGKALRRAVESYPEDIKVAIVATGGLSHQVHGERCGFNNVKWDEEFMDLLVNDPERLTELTIADYARLSGIEGAEEIMWLVMRGALSSNVVKKHQGYYLPSMTGIATMIIEDQSLTLPVETNQQHRDKIARELAGIEKLEGSYPFTQERSLNSLRLNRFLHQLINPRVREQFKQDEEKLFSSAGLNEKEREMLRQRDWRKLIQYGASFFLLEKFGAVIGTSNLHIYAAMKGLTLEEFQKTRNQQVTYSVAGKS